MSLFAPFKNNIDFSILKCFDIYIKFINLNCIYYYNYFYKKKLKNPTFLIVGFYRIFCFKQLSVLVQSNQDCIESWLGLQI